MGSAVARWQVYDITHYKSGSPNLLVKLETSLKEPPMRAEDVVVRKKGSGSISGAIVDFVLSRQILCLAVASGGLIHEMPSARRCTKI